VLQAPSRLVNIGNYIYLKVISFMGRPPGRIQNRLFLMRVTEEFLETIDEWRTKREGEPSRSEAVRHLVELGLKVKGKS
jgi:hypothetical protein